jgi:N-acetyl-beta-hexosaminidase
MLELRTYPRLLAVGEIGWSTKKNKNFSRFQEKFKLFTTILDYYKINYEYKGN